MDAIKLTGVSKTYGSVTAVDALDLTVPSGQILAVLGPSEAGKSTMTEIVLGLTSPDAGSAAVFDTDPVTAMPRRRSGRCCRTAPCCGT